MSILIDRRTGSAELDAAFRSLRYTVSVVTLPAADFMFDGNGPGGHTLSIGVERKRITEILSTMQDGRLTKHQIPKMWEYFDRCYLIVEGIWRANPDTGYLETWRGNRWDVLMMGRSGQSAAAVNSYLTSIEEQGGLRIRKSRGPVHTAEVVGELYRWWQKPWDQHTAFQDYHRIAPPTVQLFQPPGLTERVVKEFPGLGWKRSRPAAKHFGTVYNAVVSAPEAWAQVEGIGKKGAARIWTALRNPKHK